MIAKDLCFGIKKLFRNFLIIVSILIIIIVFPEIPADVFVHKVKLFNFLAAGVQQIRDDVVNPLVVLNMSLIGLLNIGRLLYFIGIGFVALNGLFDSEGGGAERFEHLLAVYLQ